MRYTIITILLLSLGACSKAPINGDLDGMWQLLEIEHFDSNGQTIETKYQKNLFWSFQLHLMQLGHMEFYSRFNNTGSELRIYNLTFRSRNENASDNDDWLTEDDIPLVKRYGLYELDTHFQIERLDEDVMRLKSDSARLVFRKY